VNKSGLDYENCRMAILQLIVDKQLKVGARLPSINKLCKLLGYSQITIKRAVKELGKYGAVKTIERKGIFVATELCDNDKKILFLDINANFRTINNADIEEISKAVKKKGYFLQHIYCGKKPNETDFSMIKEAYGILATGIFTEEWNVLLSSFKNKTVILGNNNPFIEGIKTIYSDFQSQVEDAVKYFIKSGYEKIGFLNAPMGYDPSGLMENGYLKHIKSKMFYANIFYANRFQATLKYLEANHNKLEVLLVEHGILESVLVAFYIHPEWKKLKLALVGGFFNYENNCQEIINFGAQKSLFAEALEVFWDLKKALCKRKFHDDLICVENVKFCPK
jgi:DNA-binding transcriptional regulator YhcF (GntR family)